MIIISVVKPCDIPDFEPIKKLLHYVHLCEIFNHLLIVAIKFLLHLIDHQL
jgi:hypothetical protein